MNQTVLTLSGPFIICNDRYWLHQFRRAGQVIDMPESRFFLMGFDPSTAMYLGWRAGSGEVVEIPDAATHESTAPSARERLAREYAITDSLAEDMLTHLDQARQTCSLSPRVLDDLLHLALSLYPSTPQTPQVLFQELIEAAGK